ncbi:MAG: hypothetical protein Tsb0016_24540 [Sphingomonadales bacterium]
MSHYPKIWRLNIELSPQWHSFLSAQAEKLTAPHIVQRPWHWQGLHNPWSRAASLYDAWGFLDLCSDSTLLATVTGLIGADVILFDSFWFGDPWQLMGERPFEEPVFFPIRPCQGVTVTLPLPKPVSNGPQGFAARYFPASAHYIRDPEDPAQKALMERLPLYNAATAPLWLVSGVDRAANDFVTGFNPRPVFWSEAPGI